MIDPATATSRYWAFISYSSKDAAHARWLHRAIETYGVPAKVVEHSRTTPAGEPAPKRFQPVFRDRDELPASADLGQSIGEALAASRYLIVICSPNAAQSKWVNREIEAFAEMGRAGRILAFIVGGEPNSGDDRECFPPALRRQEPLAADARPQGDGRADARLKLLAGMLGVGFDALKQRESQRRIRRLQIAIAAALLLALTFAGLSWYAMQQRSIAQDQRGRAEAGQLASLSLVRRDDHFDLALLLASEAFGQYDTFDTRSALLGSLGVYPSLSTFLQGSQDRIWALAASPDGQLIAAGGESGAILLWGLEQAQSDAHVLSAGTETVLALAFSQDGETLAAGGCARRGDNGSCAEGEVRLWRTADGQDLGPLPGTAGGAVQSLAFSPDGAYLASGSGGGITLWDVAGRDAVTGTIHTTVGQVVSLAFSPDGRKLLSATLQQLSSIRDPASAATHDGLVQMWAIPEGTFGPTYQQCPGASEMSVAFREDGTPLAACTLGTLIFVWDLNTHNFTVPLAGHGGGIAALAFSGDGRRLASGGCARYKSNGLSCIQGEARLWDVERLAQIGQPLWGTASLVTSLALARDGSRLASNSATENAESSVLVWDMAAPQTLGQPLAGLQGLASSLAASPDGHTLAASLSDGTIVLADMADGAPPRTLDGDAGTVNALAFSPDGGLLASGSSDGTAWLWDTGSGTPRLGPLEDGTAPAWDVAFVPDGKTLVVASAGPIVQWWDVATGIAAAQPFTATDAGWISAMALSPAADRLAAAACLRPPEGIYDCPDARILLWDLETRDLIASTPTGGQTRVVRLAFSADGSRFASTGCGRVDLGAECVQGDVRLWEGETGRLAGEPLTDHTESAIGVAFSPDGSMLATFSEEQQIILWDTAVMHALGQFGGGMRVVNRSVPVAFGPYLVTAGEQVTQWEVDPAGWQARACRIANRNLTAVEWKTYLGDVAFDKTCPELP